VEKGAKMDLNIGDKKDMEDQGYFEAKKVY